jgi:hypothetical protein
MAKLVFGMNQSLDGYVDHQEFAPPGPSLSPSKCATWPAACTVAACTR